MPVQDCEQCLQKVRCQQLCGRCIDRELVLPQIKISQRLIQGDPKDFIEQAEFLRDRNEVFRARVTLKTAIGPPREKLMRDDLAALRVGDRLDRGFDLSILDRSLELDLKRGGGKRSIVDAWIEHRPIGAAAFRTPHRRIC